METTIPASSTEKGKKIIDLPKNVITVLAVQAAKAGKSTKAFMESLLIDAASRFDDMSTYEYLSNMQPEGHVMVSEREKEAFEKKYNL